MNLESEMFVTQRTQSGEVGGSGGAQNGQSSAAQNVVGQNQPPQAPQQQQRDGNDAATRPVDNNHRYSNNLRVFLE